LGPKPIRRLCRRYCAPGGRVCAEARAGDGGGHRFRHTAAARSHAGGRYYCDRFECADAEPRGAKFTPEDRIKFQPADAMALPFADNAFDTMVCQFGIMFYPDKEKSYAKPTAY